MKILLPMFFLISLLMGNVLASSDNVAYLANAEVICPGLCCDLPCYIKYATRFIYPLAALGLLGAWIYAGFLRITAAGNVEKVQKSNKILMSSIIGFIIIALSGVIVNTMCALLGVNCF